MKIITKGNKNIMQKREKPVMGNFNIFNMWININKEKLMIKPTKYLLKKLFAYRLSIASGKSFIVPIILSAFSVSLLSFQPLTLIHIVLQPRDFAGVISFL